MVTPARRQYLNLKEQHKDAILLFQMGDFYETFDDDAKLVARDAEVHLTSKEFGRDGRVPLAGLPLRALDTYLRKLLGKGHRVAICDQITEAGHGLIERAVTRIVTPGTLTEPQLLRERENTYLASVNYGRPGRDEVALAYVDVSTGEFAVAQFGGPDLEASLAAELGRLSPAEVLAPADGPPLPGPWHRVPREKRVFDGEDGATALREHFGVASLEPYGCDRLPLACGAAAAVLDYLHEYNPRLLGGLRGLFTYSTGDYMTLDAQTRRNLELARSGRDGRTGRGLLGVLDRSQTAPGGRLLRRWLSQPLLNLAALGDRHDGVGEFVDRATAREECRATLKQMGDLERLTGRTVAGTIGPRELHNLRATLGHIPALRAALVECATPVVARLRDQLDACGDVADLIERAIAAPHEGQRIRTGFDADLDALVEGTREARRWIAELERRERERTKIKSLKVGFNKVFGYFIEITKPNLHLVPDDYIRKQTLTAVERYITPELKEFEARISDAEQRITAAEDALYGRVLAELAREAPRILTTAAAIAQIDVLAAFAEVADRGGYSRPTLIADRAIHIRAGRHPTVEAAVDRHTFIPNDLDLDADELDGDGAIMLLTGPNMAGKSTYLRQVALIVLLAQIGAFVPAEEATIGLVDRIFTRVGAQDDLAAGQSTFMVEMLETASILHHATPRSLIILDEIGRGTGTLDGLAIARAVVEDIHDRIGGRCLFATHYHELLALLDALPRLRACNVAVREDADGIVFLHRIAPGGAARSYGIHVARLAGLPRRVTDRAADLLRDLEASATPLHAVRESPPTNGYHAEADDEEVMPDGDMSPWSAEDAADILEEIASLDLVNTTPLAALNQLFALQQRLHELADLPVRSARRAKKR